MIKDFNVSEKGHGSYWLLGILRWVMVLTFILVWEQRGGQVFVVEEPDNASYDPTKLFRIATA